MTEIQMSKSACQLFFSMKEIDPGWDFRTFEFGICFGFRDSNFEFQVYKKQK